VRSIDEGAIKAHADRRFRSEYDYALFEYYRSAKVIAFLERAGVVIRGRVLDAGCGGGGMPLSLAEEADFVVGIDPAERFQDAGVRLGRDRGIRNLTFALADGMFLPSSTLPMHPCTSASAPAC
jgi:SAM-dependent methyltransferase